MSDGGWITECPECGGHWQSARRRMRVDPEIKFTPELEPFMMVRPLSVRLICKRGHVFQTTEAQFVLNGGYRVSAEQTLTRVQA